MRNLPLNALRAFAAVYQSGGVRPAARALQVTHSSVSRHLRDLEAWIGLPLLGPRAGARALTFTAQGEALGRATLSGMRDLESAIAQLRESRRANAVTISTTPSIAARWLLPRLADFERCHPNIELSVIGEQRLADPEEQGADLTIRMGQGPWPDLACEPLMDDKLYPVVSPAYWQAQGESRDLNSLKLLHDRDPNASWQIWIEAEDLKDIDTRPGPRFASSDLVLRAAAQGLGIALARDRLAKDDIAAGTLMRPFGDREFTLKDAYWVVKSNTAPQRMRVAPVIAWLKNQAKTERLSL